MSASDFVWNTREDYTHRQAVRNKVVPSGLRLDVDTFVPRGETQSPKGKST